MNSSDIISYMDKFGISLLPAQADQFVRYYELLIEWNSFMNLTAITEETEVLTKHFADSLSLPKLSVFANLFSVISSDPSEINSKNDTDDQRVTLLDIGTGAGFPAIPLKIAFPGLQVTMIDSLQKRVKFLNEVIAQLKLGGIEALHGRAEDFAKNVAHREQYDFVVSRAVANLSTLSEYCLPYVKVDGYFVSYKSIEAIGSAPSASAKAHTNIDQSDTESVSEYAAAEKAIALLGGKAEDPLIYSLPDTDIDHCLLPIRKIKSTPKKFPRKAGLPAKEPL